MKAIFYWTIVLSIFLVSCKKSIEDIQLDTKQETVNIFEKSESNFARIRIQLDEAAKTFSQIIANKEVRNIIKQKALLRFDGDYNILYSTLKSEKLQDGNTIENILNNLNPKFSQIASSIPKFNISVPVECDNWNANEYLPSVAIQPFGLSERKLITIKSYTVYGQVEYLNAQKDPTVPVIVLGVSERVDEKENLRPEFIDNPTMERVSGSNEITEKINCPNLGAIESWTSGAPELWQTIYGFQSNSNVNPNPAFTPVTITRQFYKPNKRNDINNRFWYCNRNLYYWYTDPNTSTSVYADATTHAWLEEDYFIPGGGLDVTLGISGTIKVKIFGIETSFTPNASVTFNIENDDDDCGSNTVHFLDPITNIYSTGLVEWKQMN